MFKKTGDCVTSSYHISHFKPGPTGPDPSYQATRLMAGRARKNSPGRLQPELAFRLVEGQLVRLPLEPSSPVAVVQEIVTTHWGVFMAAVVELSNGTRLRRGRAAIELIE